MKNKNRKRQKQSSSSRARAGTSSASVSNLSETLPDEQLLALIEGARFAYAKPRDQTQFQRGFAEAYDRGLRFRLLEEAKREKAEQGAVLRGQELVQNTPQNENEKNHKFTKVPTQPN